jgi:hypothetical protein
VILLGGVLTGWFTPTEAGVVAYILLVVIPILNPKHMRLLPRDRSPRRCPSPHPSPSRCSRRRPRVHGPIVFLESCRRRLRFSMSQRHARSRERATLGLHPENA